MAVAKSDQLTALAAASATAGLAGAPNQVRSSQIEGHVQGFEFSFTIPASGAGSTAGDQVIIGYMSPFARIEDIVLFNGAMGANVTLSLGKTDPNNSSNTDNTHYLDATDVSVAGRVWAQKNLPEQVGTDTAGDQSTGNTAPGFGALPIEVTATIGGTPTTSAKFQGVIYYKSRP